MKNPNPEVPENPETPTADEKSAPMFRRGIPFWKSGFVLVLAGLTAGFCLKGTEAEVTTDAGVKMRLPAVLGGYYGVETQVSEAEREILPLDTEFARRNYESVNGIDQINAQIVLSGGEKRSIHRPEICLPGQGWDIADGTTVEIPLQDDKSLGAMKLTLTRPVRLSETDERTLRTVFLYWFVGADKMTPHHLERILLSSWDRVFHNTNHRWAYVVVSATVTSDFHPNGKDYEETLAMLKEFTKQIVPYFIEDEVLNNAPTPELIAVSKP